jgi:hypothetical protein
MYVSHDRPLWQSALILVGIGTALVVIGSTLLILAIFPQHCDQWEDVLSNDPRHGAIIRSQVACTSFGSTYEESIQWVSPAGRRRIIFTYEPPGGIVSHKGVAIRYPVTPSVTRRAIARICPAAYGRVILIMLLAASCPSAPPCRADVITDWDTKGSAVASPAALGERELAIVDLCLMRWRCRD